jgi:mevalonate kinase
LLTDTNQPRRTAILVAHVSHLLASLPGITAHILTAIDGITAEARKLLQSSENVTQKLGELISINQGLLNSVGVGHEKLNSVARIANDIGWTKLTGAGGGGCALTLLKNGFVFLLCCLIIDVTVHEEQAVEKLLQNEGFRPFEVNLGGHGVGILEEGVVKSEMIEDFKQSVSCVLRESVRWKYWSAT